ncbi:hypothetical protein VTK56DRAFT_1620 [Thermocarpiscus australiensis]
MDDSFESSDRFPWDDYHRHSQSRSDQFSLNYHSTLDLQPGHEARQAGAGGAYESHDDLCLDHCMGVGLYNGFQHFNHRGGPPASQARWAHDMSFSRSDYSIHLGSQPAQLHTSLASPASNPYHSWFSPHLEPCVPCRDENCHVDCHNKDCLDDCHSMADMSCCDSQCTMAGKCTDMACADTDDACTDQNCPSRPVPMPSSEVVSGAAALISINHGPEDPNHHFNLQQPVMHGLSFSLSGAAQQNYLLPPGLLPDPVCNIANHLLVAHSDQDSSACTRPCPLDDPQNYSYCHLPLYLNSAPLDQYTSVGSDLQMNNGFVECGAEIHDPESFLAHFNSQHRPLFVTGALNPTRASAGMHHRTVFASTDATSSPATPPDASASASSTLSGMPSPLTPLSNSVEMSDAKPESSPRARSTSIASSASEPLELGGDEEHRCLWRDEGCSEICGEIFADAEELFRHASEVHIKHAQKGAQGFRCGWDDCPRSEPGAAGFPQRSKIERHMQTHIGHKPHICPTCNKGFSAKQALTQHMFIHSNEKPLVCNICHKAFRYPSALTMHQRVHSGLKPLQCPVCGKRFSESSNLSKHKRTHEVKGRFTCTVPGCDRNFHRQDQLRRHMKTHQKDGDSRPNGVSEGSLERIFEHPPQS